MPGNGVKITIKVEDKALLAALAKLDHDLLPVALKNIGEVLLNSTRKRFDQQVDPDGKPWAPLNPAYKGTAADRNAKGRVTTRGVKRGDKILQEQGMRGGLLGSIVYQIVGTRLVLGTNKIYARVHQQGATIVPKKADALVFWMGGKLIHAKKVTIPARPYLGLSQEDRKDMIEAIDEVAAAFWTGGQAP